jgi:curved DNA-binding protein CbpA
MEFRDKNYYDVLNVLRDAEDNEIRRAYKKASLQAHPDKGGSDDLFKVVLEAKDILLDKSKRQAYNRYLDTFKVPDGRG